MNKKANSLCKNQEILDSDVSIIEPWESNDYDYNLEFVSLEEIYLKEIENYEIERGLYE